MRPTGYRFSEATPLRPVAYDLPRSEEDFEIIAPGQGGLFHVVLAGETRTICRIRIDWRSGSRLGDDPTCWICRIPLVEGGYVARSPEDPWQKTPLLTSRLDSYRPAGERVRATRRSLFLSDPDELDRKSRRHGIVQNRLEQLARGAGFATASPGAGDPDFDLVWSARNGDTVVEVKTLSAKNESRQLALGLGQVLDYQELLRVPGREMRAVLAVDRRPTGMRWPDLCAKHGVLLVWPETLERAVHGQAANPQPSSSSVPSSQ